MNQLQRATTCASLSIALLLTACAGNETTPNQADLQREALARWQHCLERNTDEYQAPSDLRLIVNKVCEGHKRDVLTSFPRHLESQVAEILTKSAMTFFDTPSTSPMHPVSAQMVRTLLR